MATCPNGHQSVAEDWCEVCGIRMSGAAMSGVPGPGMPGPPPAPGPPMGGGYGYPDPSAQQPAQPAELCPQCGTPREAQAPFCEECRYNFLTHTATAYVPPPPPPGMSRGIQPPQREDYRASRPSQMNRPAEPLQGEYPGHTGYSAPSAPAAPTGAGAPDPRGAAGDFMIAPPPGQQGTPAQPGPAMTADPGYGAGMGTGWVAVVTPDREYFTAMMSRSGPEAAGLNLPAYSPEQKIPLLGPQVTIGRRRQSTGESPDIDLSRPPEDPGVSHQHAVLVEQPDGTWAVVDQNSTNGTTINGAPDAIQPYVPMPLHEGDRVHVGAWTTIRLQRG